MKRLILFLMLFPCLLGYSQDQSIKKLFENPNYYLTKGTVVLVGTATSYIPSSNESERSYFMLKGDYGHVIKVQTYSGSTAPMINKRYKIEGFLTLEPDGSLLVSETKRSIDKTLIQAYWWVLVAGLLVIALIVLLIIRLTRKPKPIQVPKKPIAPAKESENPPAAGTPVPGFSTIRIELAPNTMKFIPGTFTISSQEDKGKSFKIPGFHTPDGSVVTIGREDVNNERKFAHIRIADKFATVSRKQAEILYAFDKLYVKNLSATNYTIVDGYELKPNERREISAGSVIKMGELEITYQN